MDLVDLLNVLTPPPTGNNNTGNNNAPNAGIIQVSTFTDPFYCVEDLVSVFIEDVDIECGSFNGETGASAGVNE